VVAAPAIEITGNAPEAPVRRGSWRVFSAWISWLSRSISSRKRPCMKNARLKVFGEYCPSIISFDSVLCQVTASGMRCSRATRLFLSKAATAGGSGVPSLPRMALSMAAA
jgi:hypothetical protein